MITMVLAGLWHGAAWTYVVFGAIQGVALLIEHALFPLREKSEPEGFFSLWAQRFITFNVFCLTLLFFRAPSLGAAVQMLGSLSDFSWRIEYLAAFGMLFLFSLPLLLVDLHLESSGEEYPLARAPYALRTASAVAAIVVLAIFTGNDPNAFIYFQF